MEKLATTKRSSPSRINPSSATWFRSSAVAMFCGYISVPCMTASKGPIDCTEFIGGNRQPMKSIGGDLVGRSRLEMGLMVCAPRDIVYLKHVGRAQHRRNRQGHERHLWRDAAAHPGGKLS